jgi:hypothetical protein
MLALLVKMLITLLPYTLMLEAFISTDPVHS